MDRTWVKLLIPTPLAPQMSVISPWTSAESRTADPVTNITTFYHSHAVADHSPFPLTLPWLFAFGSFTGEWSPGAVIHDGNPASTPTAILCSETASLPTVAVAPNGRVIHSELTNARLFLKKVRVISATHSCLLLSSYLNPFSLPKE